MVNRRVAMKSVLVVSDDELPYAENTASSGRVNLCPRRGRNGRALVPFAIYITEFHDTLGLCSLRFIS